MLPAKRAVTRPCPVCQEDIPVRLLAAHAELEAARVEEILRSVGSTEVLEEAEPDDGYSRLFHPYILLFITFSPDSPPELAVLPLKHERVCQAGLRPSPKEQTSVPLPQKL